MMVNEEKKSPLVLCCIIIILGIVSKAAYNFYMSKAIQYISKYVSASLIPYLLC